MFKVGDKIDYDIIRNVEIIGEDEKHFVLRDKTGYEKRIYKTLVNKYGKILEASNG